MDEINPYGWWGKYKRVNGEMRLVWIGPMTREQMKEKDCTYRHNFSATDPDKRESSDG